MREGDSGDEIDIPSVVGPCRIEQVSHQLTSKLTSVACVLHRWCNLHPGDPSLGCDPKPNFVAPMGHTIWGIEHPLWRGGEDITRSAARARAGIGAHALAGARAIAAARPWSLPGTTHGSFAGSD